jgi:hypothetical protein
MASFIHPSLRHNKAAAVDLQIAPAPVQELYGALLEVTRHSTAAEVQLQNTVNRLAKEFCGYASFFQAGLEDPTAARFRTVGSQPTFKGAKGPFLRRTWERWQRSYRKRFG